MFDVIAALPRPATIFVDGLRELANRHADPEMFDHLAVYAGDHVLLAAYDVGLDPICVSRALPAPVQRRIFEIVAN